MSRLILVVMLIVLSSMVLSSHRAAAFTLRSGPVAAVAPTGPGTEDASVPTPQLFRVAVDSRGVTLGTTAPTERYGAPEPALQLSKQTVVPATETAQATPEATPHFETPATTRRLSGVELLLLQKTSVVANRQGK